MDFKMHAMNISNISPRMETGELRAQVLEYQLDMDCQDLNFVWCFNNQERNVRVGVSKAVSFVYEFENWPLTLLLRRKKKFPFYRSVEVGRCAEVHWNAGISNVTTKWHPVTDTKGECVGQVLVQVVVDKGRRSEQLLTSLHLRVLDLLEKSPMATPEMKVSKNLKISLKVSSRARDLKNSKDLKSSSRTTTSGTGEESDDDKIVPGYEVPLEVEDSESSDERSAERFEWVRGVGHGEMVWNVEMLTGCWKRLRKDNVLETVVQNFYKSIYSHASIAHLFSRTTPERQNKMFIDMMDLILRQVTEPENVIPLLSDLSTRHVAFGVLPAHYDTVGNALLVALAEADKLWSQSLERAWRMGFTLIASTMMEASRRAYVGKGCIPPSLMDVAPEVPGSYFYFNNEFQSAVERLWKNEKDTAAWSQLCSTAEDFENAALTVGKLIIMEQFLPESARAVRDRHYGGRIGGSKYLQHGIFFKLAKPDGKYITTYDGAAKVQGHELKGCTCYFDARIHGIHLPIMSLIDFGGCRIIAVSVLPINPETLVMGTGDGGATIKGNDLVLLQRMESAAKVLNLKEHVVGLTKLHGAADIEGHFSPADKRRYLIDFSRAFPPEWSPAGMEGERRFTKLLRPELVQQNGVSLNPDCFSGFKSLRPEEQAQYEEDCANVRAAQARLLKKCEQVVPQLEQSLTRAWAGVHGAVNWLEALSRTLHFSGINVRKLGLIYQMAKSRDLKMLLTVEMLSRTIKRYTRGRFRDVLGQCKFGIMEGLFGVAADVFNKVLDNVDPFLAEMNDYFKIAWADPEEGRHDLTISDDSVFARKAGKITSGGSLRDRRSSEQTQVPRRLSQTSANPPEVAPPKRSGRFSLKDEPPEPRVHRASSSDLGLKFFSRRKSTAPTAASSPEGKGSTSSNSSSSSATMRTSSRSNSPRASGSPSTSPREGEGAVYRSDRLIRTMLFCRLCQQLCVTFSNRVLSAVELGNSVTIERVDVIKVEPRLKSMNIVAHGRAMAMLPHKQDVQMLATSIQFLQQALSGPLISSQLLRSYAEAVEAREELDGTLLMHSEHVDALYQQALTKNPRDSESRLMYAKFRRKIGDFFGARMHLLKGMAEGTNPAVCADEYVSVLEELKLQNELQSFLSVHEVNKRPE